jgi:ligand-binding sensor domain-containing protein/serine phosphatase RsbU (regulator of sigma subunit)
MHSIHRLSALIHVLLLLSACCENNKRTSSETIAKPKTVEAKGYIVPKDSMHEPKVIFVDQNKLKKVPAGKPKVVFTNLNVHPAGEPKIKIIDLTKVKSVTPGTDTFSIPKVVLAIDSPFIAKQPKPIQSSPFRMKDAATCNIQYLDVDQGMNSSYVRTILQDKFGNLWFGTDGGGVSKFDGKSFLHFTDKEGLLQKTVLSILEDRFGNLWFGTHGGGVSRYDGKRFTYFTKKEGLCHNTVMSILEDRKGNLWFGTDGGGVSRYDGKQFTHFSSKEGLSDNSVWSILEDSNGCLWFGTPRGGVSKYDGKSFTHFTEETGLSHNAVLCILEDKFKNLWFGTAGGGVSKYDGKCFTHFTRSEGLSQNTVLSIGEDRLGNLWFGTYGGGVSRYDGKTFIHITEKEGLSRNTVLSILEDKSGNLWFGTHGGGVTKYDDRSFRHFTEKEAFNENEVWSIYEDRSGNIWLGTYRGGVLKYDGSSFTHFTQKEGLSSNFIKSVFEDKNGNLWFGTDADGVTKFDGKNFTHFTAKDGLSNKTVWSILEDRSGNLWFCTDGNGVYKYDGKSFCNYTDKQGLSHNSVRSVFEDKTGNLWFGTDGGGLSKFDGKGFTHFPVKEKMTSKYIWCINEDRLGNLWFGTDDGGAMKYDGTHFTHYTENNGLNQNKIWSIVSDGSIGTGSRLWFATDMGLSCFLENENRFISYRKEDGLKAEDFFQNSAFLDSKNRIWWGSGKALTMLDMNEFRLNESTPTIQLENIHLQEKFVDFPNINTKNDTTLVYENSELAEISFTGVAAFHNYPEDLRLPYYINHLTFNFSAIDWYAPHKIQYQYKLEGLDPDWNQLSSDNKADYRNIPFGNYVFKVKAIGSANKWSKTFEYPFQIHPPWWRTWWAYAIYGSLLVALVVLIVWWNGRKLRARAEELKTEVDKATFEIITQKHVIEEKHKEITDSINYAERIQKSFLATKELLDENLKDHFVFFQPKDVVSGDFYWASKLNNGEFVLATADSTGHGVPGAIMSLLNITSLEKAIEHQTSPSGILSETRKIIIERLKKDGSAEGGKDGMDCSVISFDFVNSKLTYAAANNSVWVVRGNVLIELDPDKMPVGKHDKDTVPFKQHEFELQKGDVIYTLTDGFPDQFGGPKGKKFMYKRLKEYLISIAKEPMDIQKQKLLSELNAWKGNLEQVDDVTIIGIRI